MVTDLEVENHISSFRFHASFFNGRVAMEFRHDRAGRMGANMTERLLRGGHKLIIYDRSPEAIQRCVDKRRVRRAFAGRLCQASEFAARHLADGAIRRADSAQRSSSCFPVCSRTTSSSMAAITLQRFHPARRKTKTTGHSLRRRRHQRRHLGSEGYCLMIGGESDRRPARADFQDVGAGEWLRSRRRQRRRTFR